MCASTREATGGICLHTPRSETSSLRAEKTRLWFSCLVRGSVSPQPEQAATWSPPEEAMRFYKKATHTACSAVED